MAPVTTLTFRSDAEAAVAFYLSVFDRSRVTAVTRHPRQGLGPPGSVMTIAFELDGRPFLAMNGGPHFGRFSDAVSLSIECATQAEIDRYWQRLGEGGEHGPGGWLKDRFGVSWQVLPRALAGLLADPQDARCQRVMQALLRMKKIDLAALQAAHAGRPRAAPGRVRATVAALS